MNKIHYSNQGVTKPGLEKCVQISFVEKDGYPTSCFI